MIVHASIPADDPERVARVCAELLGCSWHPGVFPDTYTVAWGDAIGYLIEVGPRGLQGAPGAKEIRFVRNEAPSPYSECHLNVPTALSLEEITAIGAREGWTAMECDRGGVFKVIEFWLEDKFMLELMTPVELARYSAACQRNFGVEAGLAGHGHAERSLI